MDKDEQRRAVLKFGKYVKIGTLGTPYLEVGQQSFNLGEGTWTVQRSEWFRKQVCIALANMFHMEEVADDAK